MWSSFSSIIAMSIVFAWVYIDRTDGVAISVWHDLQFSINRFFLSISYISIFVWTASSISWRLVFCVFSFCCFSLLSWLRVRKDCWYGIFSSKSSRRYTNQFILKTRKKCIFSQNRYSISTHINEWNTMVEKYHLP